MPYSLRHIKKPRQRANKGHIQSLGIAGLFCKPQSIHQLETPIVLQKAARG